MARFVSPPKATYTLRALAHLLRYPDAGLREHLGELPDFLPVVLEDRKSVV